MNIVDEQMEHALHNSMLSTCQRPVAGNYGVGCVITTTEFFYISGGYNGNANGLYQKCDSDIPGQCGCIHAEERAAINCMARKEIGKLVFCTHLPCKMCAKRLIILGGVKKVYYKYDYRSHEGIELLNLVNIETIHLD